MNITFFIKNWILNIFILNNFLEKQYFLKPSPDEHASSTLRQLRTFFWQMLDHVDEARTHAALTSNTHCAYNEQCVINQILSVFGANTKEVLGAIWTGLNDIYVRHDLHDWFPLIYTEKLQNNLGQFSIFFINVLH